jgi:tryptophan-rich hypothetical protein
MNINPEKLHHSKWTAVKPQNKEKHFIVTDVLKDDQDRVQDVVLEAVLTKRVWQMPWRDLKNASNWLAGWQ